MATTLSSSIHLPTSPSVPEEDLQITSEVSLEEVQESFVQEPTQVEAEEASEERNPEGQEVE